ncbi:MAG: preprotein translocase subunit YajC [Acidimicrobiales bacterium]
MMAIFAALAAPSRLFPSFAATAPAKPGGSSGTLLILVVIAAGFYFLVLRPQQQKAKRLRQNVQQFEVGDEVLTAGGIVGHIIEVDGDRVTLETSMGASFVVLRQYILRKLNVDIPVVDDHDTDEYDNEDNNEDNYHGDGGDEDEQDQAGDADDDDLGDPDDPEDDGPDDPDGRRPKRPS